MFLGAYPRYITFNLILSANGPFIFSSLYSIGIRGKSFYSCYFYLKTDVWAFTEFIKSITDPILLGDLNDRRFGR